MARGQVALKPLGRGRGLPDPLQWGQGQAAVSGPGFLLLQLVERRPEATAPSFRQLPAGLLLSRVWLSSLSSWVSTSQTLSRPRGHLAVLHQPGPCPEGTVGSAVPGWSRQAPLSRHRHPWCLSLSRDWIWTL